MNILAHRGINLPNNKYLENSRQAFENCLVAGFGLEFDVNFTKDNKTVICHDDDLRRLSQGHDRRKIKTILANEFKKIVIKKNSFCDLGEVLTLLVKYKKFGALHLKGKFQNKKHLDVLIKELLKYPQSFKKLMIFDVRPAVALYLKKKLPQVSLAASVAHTFDIKRYGKLTDDTLLSLKQISKYKKNYDWAWLDEWDLIDKNDSVKKFYTNEVFKQLKKQGMKISLVTPELHSETHPDGQGQRRLAKRLKQILSLKPDAVCTDWSLKVKTL